MGQMPIRNFYYSLVVIDRIKSCSVVHSMQHPRGTETSAGAEFEQTAGRL